MGIHLAKAAIYLLLFLPQFLMAQDSYSISGRVVDFEEQPIVGAKVFIVDGDSTITNGNGQYVFENQLAGRDYQIYVSKNDEYFGKVNVADRIAMQTKDGWTLGPSGHNPINAFNELPYDVDCTNRIDIIDNVFLPEFILDGFIFRDIYELDFWAFVRKSFEVDEPYDETNVVGFIQIDSLVEESRNNDFFGYIKGDVIDDEELETTNSVTSLILEDVIVCSQKVLLPVEIRSESMIKDWQFGMKFPKEELEFVGSKDFYAKQDEDFLYVMNINNHFCDTLFKGFLEFKILDPEQIKNLEFESGEFQIMIVSCDLKLMNTLETNAEIKVLEPFLAMDFDIEEHYEFDCGNNEVEFCVTPIGGVPPYQISWENGPTDSCHTISETSLVEFTVTDGRGCAFFHSQNVRVDKPDPIWLPFTDVWHPTHTTSGDGYIRINNTYGGTFPFEYNWSNGDTGFHIENLNAGSYTVTVTDDNDCQFVQTYTLVAPVWTSTDPAFAESSYIQIHPNPSESGNGVLQIEVSQPQGGQLELFDVNGKKVMEQSLQIEGLSKSVALETDLPKGIYLIRVDLEMDGRRRLKWLIQ